MAYGLCEAISGNKVNKAQGQKYVLMVEWSKVPNF